MRSVLFWILARAPQETGPRQLCLCVSVIRSVHMRIPGMPGRQTGVTPPVPGVGGGGCMTSASCTSRGGERVLATPSTQIAVQAHP